MGITATNKAILLKNETVTLELSRKDASLLSVVTADGVDITGEKKSFFALTDESLKTRGLIRRVTRLFSRPSLVRLKLPLP